MTSTYTANQGIEKPATGDQSGTWGGTVNTNMDIIDRAVCGVGALTLTGSTTTLTTTDGALTDGMYRVLVLGDGGDLGSNNTITISPNDQDKLYLVYNNLSASRDAIFSQGTGANATVTNGASGWIYADGAGAGAAVTLAILKSALVPTTLTDGGVLLGSGTGEITAMSVLSDSQMIVGNGTTDPVAESGATLRTSIGVGTGDTPTFTGINLGAENLDDYDEGTWTPSISPETGSISAFTLREGVYVRIGEWVNCTGTIDVNTISSPGGNLTFSGIPFTLPDNDGNQGAFTCNANGWTGLGTASIHGVQTKNATTGIVGKAGASGSINDVAGDMQNGCGLHFTISFSVV